MTDLPTAYDADKYRYVLSERETGKFKPCDVTAGWSTLSSRQYNDGDNSLAYESVSEVLKFLTPSLEFALLILGD